MIPRIIHQTWKDKNIPEKWQKTVRSCKKVYYDCEYKLWTDEEMLEFVMKHYPWFVSTYLAYPHMIQRCDAFRYLVLYKIGGMYIDLDVGCKKRLNIEKYDLILAPSATVNTLTNSFMASAPDHPFMRKCIENLKGYSNRYNLLGRHLHVMMSTGPLYIQAMYNMYSMNSMNDNENKTNGIKIMKNEEYMGDCSECNKMINACDGGSYFYAVTGKSWIGMDTKLYEFVLCKRKLLIGLCMILIILFVKRRYLLK